MQKDDVIIRKAIVHILDCYKGYLSLSDSMLDLTPDLNDFIRGHIYKLVAGDDTKKCRFEEENSMIYSMLEVFDENDEEEYIAASKKIAESLFDIMCESEEIPAADFIMASFQIESTVHLALLKMNYKENYIHNQIAMEEDGEIQNSIIKERIILPPESAKLTEAAIINLKTMDIKIVEKKYEINGEKVNYFSERFLICHTQMAPKKKFDVLNKAIQDIHNKFDEKDIASKMEAKSILQQQFEEKKEFDVNTIGEQIFGDHQVMLDEFHDKLEKYDMQYDTFTVQNERTIKKLEKQVLVTDSGIEITIPMEEFNTKNNVEIIEEPGGGTKIIIKNIENVILK